MSDVIKVLPEQKQTTLGLYVTAKEAYEKWQADPDNVIVLDVRTPEEMLFVGHPAMAWKIPIATQSYTWDEATGKFPVQLAPDFVERVQSVLKPDATILALCRSGGRSAIAANMLANAGFTNVYNVIDGMEGDMVNDLDSLFFGQRLHNGWKNSGNPWTYDLTPDRLILPGAS
jgi:rhodanese-related sulfurtransferase